MEKEVERMIIVGASKMPVISIKEVAKKRHKQGYSENV